MKEARKSVSFQNGAAAEKIYGQKKMMKVDNSIKDAVKNKDAGSLGKKISCWQCYKLFYEPDGAECTAAKDKKFCSKLCLAKFENDHLVAC